LEELKKLLKNTCIKIETGKNAILPADFVLHTKIKVA